MTRAFTSALAFLLTLAACESGSGERQFEPGRKTYDTSELNVGAIGEDASTRERILRMPFGEAAARLGTSLRYEAEGRFVFSRGGDEYEQTDHFEVAQDTEGNFEVGLETPEHSLTVYQVGAQIFVRYDRGALRGKPRREVDIETWTDLAYASLAHALEPFRPQMKLSAGRTQSVGGREALRVGLGIGPADASQIDPDLVPTLGPVSPPARWRELAEPLDLTGHLLIDTQSGVVLRSKIEGRLQVADRDVRPTELRLHFESGVTEIGALAPIEAPESRPEYERHKPPQDVLSFFREHLPEPEPPEPPAEAE